MTSLMTFVTFSYSYNEITSLPEDLNQTIWRTLPRKVLINIAGNVIPCDCNLSLVKAKLVSSSNGTGILFPDFNVKVGLIQMKEQRFNAKHNISICPFSADPHLHNWALYLTLIFGVLWILERWRVHMGATHGKLWSDESLDIFTSPSIGSLDLRRWSQLTVAPGVSQLCLPSSAAVKVEQKYIAHLFITKLGIVLDLSHNNISELDTKLPDNISKIDLSYNFLNTVPDPSMLPSSLKSLYLKNNMIRSLKDDSLNYFQTFESLTLGNNPLTLNCTKTSQLEVIKNLNNVEDKEDLTLQVGTKKKPLISTLEEDICPHDSKSFAAVHYLVIVFSCILPSIVIGLFGN